MGSTSLLEIRNTQRARPGSKLILLLYLSHPAVERPHEIKLGLAATVNVKPNLQIVADDVKCSHGCAVSDLEEEQLFYFRRALILVSCITIMMHHSKAVTLEAVSKS